MLYKEKDILSINANLRPDLVFSFLNRKVY